jgi:hypothetical protein
LDIRPPSDSDGESSDGGEYLPDNDEEEEDAFPDTDGFASESGDPMAEDIDLEGYNSWSGSYNAHDVQDDMDWETDYTSDPQSDPMTDVSESDFAGEETHIPILSKPFDVQFCDQKTKFLLPCRPMQIQRKTGPLMLWMTRWNRSSFEYVHRALISHTITIRCSGWEAESCQHNLNMYTINFPR